MATKISGGNSTAGLVNVNSNHEMEVCTPLVIENAGFTHLATEGDDGTVTGSRSTIAIEGTEDSRLRVGLDTTIFNISFEGTNVPTAHLTQTVTGGGTIAQSSGLISIAGSTTTGQAATLRSLRTFPLFGSFSTYFEAWVKEANHTTTNSVTEWGFGYPSAATAAVTDGAFFRRLSGGELAAVIAYNSNELVVPIVTTNLLGRDGLSSYAPTEIGHYIVEMNADSVKFWINGTLVARIEIPTNQTFMSSSSAQPLFFRVNNTGTPSPALARTIYVGLINVSVGEMNTGKPWTHVMTGAGGGSYQTQPGNAAGPTITRASGSTGWPASATARIAGTWTATSAPALNNLGGLWTTPAISTLASDADYPVFSYLNPAGTASLPGKTLYVTGVRVGEAYVSTAASTNAILLSYIIGVGSTSSATNGTDSTTVVAPRPITIGGHGFTSSEAVGNYKPGFDIKFDAPLVIPPGCYFQFIVRPFGTVTSNSLVVTSSLAVNGYFE